MNLKVLAQFLKKVAKVNVAIGLLLAFLASAIIQVSIPGTTVLEVILSVLVTAFISWFTYQKEQEKGIVATIYGEEVPA
jgi:hypothetical protein